MSSTSARPSTCTYSPFQSSDCTHIDTIGFARAFLVLARRG